MYQNDIGLYQKEIINEKSINSTTNASVNRL